MNMSLSVEKTRWCCEALLFWVAFVFLGVYNAEYLYRLQSQTLFLSNGVFASETLPQAAGLLVYVSLFLNQILYHPLLAAFLMAAGLVGIERLLGTLTTCGSHCKVVALHIPSCLLLLATTSAGYAVYDNFDSSYAVALELGLILSLALAKVALLVGRKGRVGLLVCTVLALLLHFALGFFSAFSLLMAGVSARQNNRQLGLQFLLSALLVAVVVPFLSSSIFSESYLFVFLAPLPVPYFSNLFLLALVTLIAAALVVLLPASKMNSLFEKSLVSPFAVFLMLVAVFLFSFRDANYRTLLKMQHHFENMELDQLLLTASDVERPTRAIAGYRYAALNLKNRAQNELFDFPVRYDTLNSPYTNLDPLIFYPDLFLGASQLNMSILWNMEAWTNTRRSVGALKRFAILAVVQDEKLLAHKYLDLLKQTMCYKAWAEKFEGYIGNQAKLFTDYPYYGVAFANQIATDMTTPPTTLQHILSSCAQIDDANMKNRMLLHLYDKRTDDFMTDLRVASKLYKQSMPQYMQEVLALYAIQGASNAIKYFPVQKEVYENVKTFLQAAQPYLHDPEKGAEELKAFKGMYVYYMLFANPVPSSNNINVKK